MNPIIRLTYRFWDAIDVITSPFKGKTKELWEAFIFQYDMTMRLYKTDYELNKTLVEYLDNPNITPVRLDEYEVRFGDLSLWGCSVPYGCFQDRDSMRRLNLSRSVNRSKRFDGMPTRRTVIRILEALDEYPYSRFGCIGGEYFEKPTDESDGSIEVPYDSIDDDDTLERALAVLKEAREEGMWWV